MQGRLRVHKTILDVKLSAFLFFAFHCFECVRQLAWISAGAAAGSSGPSRRSSARRLCISQATRPARFFSAFAGLHYVISPNRAPRLRRLHDVDRCQMVLWQDVQDCIFFGEQVPWPEQYDCCCQAKMVGVGGPGVQQRRTPATGDLLN